MGLWKIFSQFSKVGCFSVWEKETNLVFWVSPRVLLLCLCWDTSNPGQMMMNYVASKTWIACWPCGFLHYSLPVQGRKIIPGTNYSQLWVSVWNCLLVVDLVFISTTLNLWSGCLTFEVSKGSLTMKVRAERLPEVHVPEIACALIVILQIPALYPEILTCALCSSLSPNGSYRCLK